MRFGVCFGFGTANVKTAADCGYDYIESNFGGIVRATEEEFKSFKAALVENSITCEAANCFLPNELPPVGENVDYDALRTYLHKGMSRSEELGIKTVVFGSGKARAVPVGFPFGEAFKQLVSFLSDVVSPIALDHGITVVTEPLRRFESNIINSGCEGAMLAALADKPNIKCLVDLFHMSFCGDTNDTVRLLKGMLVHAHISNPVDGSRDFPKAEDPFDYKSFIEALEFAGCPRCSVEAKTSDFATDAQLSIKLLRGLQQ